MFGSSIKRERLHLLPSARLWIWKKKKSPGEEDPHNLKQWWKPDIEAEPMSSNELYSGHPQHLSDRPRPLDRQLQWAAAAVAATGPHRSRPPPRVLTGVSHRRRRSHRSCWSRSPPPLPYQIVAGVDCPNQIAGVGYPKLIVPLSQQEANCCISRRLPIPQIYPVVEEWVEDVLMDEGNAMILTLFACLVTVLLEASSGSSQSSTT
ncbi:hypothetical protein PR202_gb21031 [Eleusine coracana subsp. coracana]|uniref:Uncharacterized protein n=1 Tax=Eleusine coracana subsp. coracana TaxID=191504 RepID=A0AAV5FC73_ELECO|nr:hypothetical protein PR202_gb21031 [Eleusine coracana subsp. coracana]